jgi:hypothetical protein
VVTKALLMLFDQSFENKKAPDRSGAQDFVML